MRSASYYDRKAWDYTNIGNWAARDRMRTMARKARAIAKRRKMPISDHAASPAEVKG